MSVSLNPSNSLGFHRPLTQLAKRSLTITNNNHQPIAFKVKTTAPKLYCVRPNSGRVEPGHTVEVSVMLQAMREEPPQNAKCKDKFLIQSTLITPDKETLSLQDIWAAPEGAEELTKVHQQKLRVTYLPPEGQTVPEEVEPPVPPVIDNFPPPPVQLNGVHHSSSSDAKQNGIHDDVDHTKEDLEPNTKDAQRSMTPHNEYTFAREESNETDEHGREVHIQDLPPHSRIPSAPTPLAVSAFETQISYPEDEEEEGEEEHQPASEPDQAPLSIPLPSSRLPSGQPSISGRFQPEDIESHPVFQELVSRYNATIAELEHVRNEYAASTLASESGLRRRRPRSDAGSVGSDTEIMDDGVYHQDGVPLQIVVIIALAVFVTTYLFL